jgi:hypothetical protein
MIRLPENILDHLPHVDKYSRFKSDLHWGITTTDNPIYLNQQWGSLDAPYCPQAEVFLHDAEHFTLPKETDLYDNLLFPFTPEEIIYFDPSITQTYHSIAIAKRDKIPTCFVRDDLLHALYLGTPRIIARAGKHDKPVYFKGFRNKKQALVDCPIPYVKPVVVLIREADNQLKETRIFDKILSVAGDILAGKIRNMQVNPPWSIMQER